MQYIIYSIHNVIHHIMDYTSYLIQYDMIEYNIIDIIYPICYLIYYLVYNMSYTIYKLRQFEETGCLCKGKSPGRPRVSDSRIERVREAFLRISRKSVARASRELNMPKMTVWKVLRKRLCFKPY